MLRALLCVCMFSKDMHFSYLQSSFFTELREIVRGEDLDRFDEIAFTGIASRKNSVYETDNVEDVACGDPRFWDLDAVQTNEERSPLLGHHQRLRGTQSLVLDRVCRTCFSFAFASDCVYAADGNIGNFQLGNW